jgi:hypothetical protein
MIRTISSFLISLSYSSNHTFNVSIESGDDDEDDKVEDDKVEDEDDEDVETGEDDDNEDVETCEDSESDEKGATEDGEGKEEEGARFFGKGCQESSFQM